jgi:polyhydroxyalkanoate synthesis repressor PhaR
MIKKYPNRRLYDTVESRYITRADVQRMVIDQVDFVVVDKSTRQDITRAILLQIISQQEDRSDPVMSRDFLSRVIRSHGGAARGVTASYLEQSMKLLTAQLDERGNGESGPDDTQIGGLAQQNYERWRAVQEDIRRTLHDAARLAADAERPPQAIEAAARPE